MKIRWLGFLVTIAMIVITTIYALANLVADILYAVLNPRIRVSGSAG